LLASHAENRFYRYSLAAALNNRALLLYRDQKTRGQAQADLERAEAIWTELASQFGETIDYAAARGLSYMSLAKVLQAANNDTLGLNYADKSIDLLKRVLGREPRHAEARRWLAAAYRVRYYGLSKLHRFDEAVKAIELGLPFVNGEIREQMCLERLLTIAGGVRRGRAAVTELEVVLQDPPVEAFRRPFNAACVYAAASETVESADERDRWNRRAVELLVQAAEACDSARGKDLVKQLGNPNSPLRLLRGREDYQEFLKHTEKWREQ
jgi:hypothetical protein